MEAPTKRQAAILRFIKERIAELSMPPTVREIGTKFKINSPNGVMCHLKALEKKGLLFAADSASRGWVPTEKPKCRHCGKEI